MSAKLRPFTVPRRVVLGSAALPFAARVAMSAAAAPPLRFVLFDDGVFDLEGGSVALRGCFPAFDEAAIHPIRVEVERRPGGGRIRYTLTTGVLTLELGGGDAAVSATLEGFAAAPHHVFPLAGARVEGARRFYRQGLGFGGPSGVYEVAKADLWTKANVLHESAWSYDSYLATALIGSDDSAFAIGALEHGQFLQRTTLYDRTRRFQLIDKRALVDVPIVECGFATERIPLGGRPLRLPTLHVVPGPTPFVALQALARKIGVASRARTNKPPRFHWDTWYEYLDDYDLARLEDVIEGWSSVKPTVPIQGIVVDAGYCPLGDWTIAKPPRWPGGIEAAFKKIRDAGLEPGAYVGPFMVSSHSELYRRHPDAVLHGLDGKPLVHGQGKPLIDTLHATETRYFLDTSHPAAFEHVRTVFKTLHGWGARFFKTDFWEWGFKDSTEVRRHKPGKTSVQYLVDVIRMVREVIGEESYFMGCIAPLAPFIGYVDSMRVGYDTEPGGFHPDGNMVNMLRETHAGQYFNEIFWTNDPDVVYLRGTTNPLGDEEVEALAYWTALMGGVVATSDRLHRLWPHRLELLRFIQPGRRKQPARFPFWSEARKEYVAVRRYDDRKAWALLVLNPNEQAIDVRCPLPKAIAAKGAYAFEWGPGRAKRLGYQSALDGTLAPHRARLYYLAETDRPPPRDLALSGELVAGIGGSGPP